MNTILIEVRDGCVTNVWCSEPDGAEVVVRDLDIIEDNHWPAADELYDPLVAVPDLTELRVPHFVIY